MRSICTNEDELIIQEIGTRHKQKRLQQGIIHMSLVENLGIARNTVSRFEKGNVGTSLLVFARLVQIIDKTFFVGLIDISENAIISDIEILSLLGKKYRGFRVETGKTQKDIADMIQVSLPTVSRFERGKGTSLLVFVKLLRAVNKIDLFASFLFD